jgi:hypothetical protein
MAHQCYYTKIMQIRTSDMLCHLYHLENSTHNAKDGMALVLMISKCKEKLAMYIYLHDSNFSASVLSSSLMTTWPNKFSHAFHECYLIL